MEKLVFNDVITNIKSDVSFSLEKNNDYYHLSFDGLIIETENKGTIYFGIGNGQSCCEHFGFEIDENYHNLFGATLLSIESTEENPLHISDSWDGGGVSTIKVTTDKGDFFASVFNFHNGYYGHTAILETQGFETNQKETWIL